jgi:hypothetical protein
VLLSIGVVVVIVAVLMAACGNRGGDPTPDATGAASPAETATTAPLDGAATGAPDAATQAAAPTATEGAVDPAAATVPATVTSTVAATDAGGVSPAGAAGSVTPTVAVSLPLVAAPACAVETSAELAGYNELAARLGCPLADAMVEQVAINEFGEGPAYNRFMLWFGDEQQIYVLQPDGGWLAYTDTWNSDEPEILCNPDGVDPETSPPLPRRGFGKLWCTVESVRLTMGVIDREERLCQHAVVQRFEQGRLLACFEDATIRYFRLLEDGSWDMEMVQ